MATQGGSRITESYRASADLRTHQYKVVEVSGADTVALANAATDVGFGILDNKPNLGEAAEVVHLGRTQAVVDGSGTAIAAGDWLGPNASGVLVRKATADFSVCARALGAATTAGAIISVFVFPPAFFRSAAG